MVKRFRVMVALCGAGVGILALYWPFWSGTFGARRVEQPRQVPYLEPDVAPWQAFLHVVVDGQGRVDYQRALGQRQLLDAYLAQVARATPARFPSSDHKLAFYINAYNALVIASVLDHWPIASVDEVGGLHKFFRQRVHRVAGSRVSLHGFESRVIRNYNPLLHFGLNCASASCPPLSPQAYLPQNLQAQLRAAASRFINDPAHNRYDPHTRVWHLSKILQWYEDDFGGRQGVIRLLRDHASEAFDSEVELRFLPYDWSLNIGAAPPAEPGAKS